jgi:large subunit ribosomal protein L24
MKIRKGDTVKIISGDDKGKIGKVVKAFPAIDKIIVEKINVVKKHERCNGINPFFSPSYT